MRGNLVKKCGRKNALSRIAAKLLAVMAAAVLLCSMLMPGLPVYAVSGSEIAADGEYYGTITATKRKDNDRYYATLYVGVEDGVISYVSISANKKADKFYEYALPQAQSYVGQPASLSSISDAVSSASQSGGSSKYTMNVAEAMREALSSAPARTSDGDDDSDDSGDSDGKPDKLASAGTYTGREDMSNGHWIELKVTVDSDGKISDISISDADGNWDSLLSEVKSDYIGTYADLSDDDNEIDAVTGATEKGYRQAIANAIKNAINGNTSDSDDSDDTGDGDDTEDPVEEDVVYEAGTEESVSGKTFTGKVTVKAGAVVTFENCWFPYGIELEDSTAIAIVKKSYFGTESFYIPVADNSLGEIDEKSEVTEESGLRVSFPEHAFDKNDSSSATDSSYKNSEIKCKPDWAAANSFELDTDQGTYYGYYLTGTAPEVDEDTAQSLDVYLQYKDGAGDSDRELRIPVVFTVKQTEEPDPDVTSDNGETIIDPGIGGVETDKDDSFELSKGVNVTNVLPGNTFTLTLEANSRGTTSTETSTGAANILLVLDNTTSMTTAYGSGTRLEAMKEAANSFVSGLPESEESQIAMMSFVIGNYASPTTTDVAWTSLGESAKSSVSSAINGLTAPQQTYGYNTSYVTPLNAAAAYLDSTGNDNPTYVVFFTDGDDMNDQSVLESTANALKAKAKAVFSIGIVQARYWSDDEDAFRAKAKAIASQEDYYYEPATAADLTAAFHQSLQIIQKEISSSKTTLDASAVFRDVVNTDKFDVSGATAKVTVYDYEDGSWSPLTDASASAGVGESGTLSSWTDQSEEDGTLTVHMDSDGTVTITGFSYKDHYLPTNDQEAEGVNAQRLHLEISGIKLKDGAQQTLDQTEVPTNVEAQSGIYKDADASSAVKKFPLPKVNIPGKGGISKTTENVQSVTVTKEWQGDAGDRVEIELLEDGEVKDTQSLSADNEWTYTWNDLDENKTYAVVEKAAYLGEEEVSEEYQTSISDPVEGTSTKTEQGWTNMGALTADSITDGGIYTFSYTYYGSAYLLGVSANNNPRPAGVGAAVENGDVPENAQWIVTKSGDGYTLRNRYSNTYLVMNQYGSLSMGETGSVFDIDDGDGSIYSGNYNIRCTSYPSTSSYSFTEFTAYELSDKTVNISSASYTITNEKKAEVPKINTGITPVDQSPLAALIAGVAVLALLSAVFYFIRKKIRRA
ncbi:MAG: VWA domain-containing protein [Lachnospiraceae bacterium]|nr:VWA domain-containing protein [Lachnospiraceae bacterium]